MTYEELLIDLFSGSKWFPQLGFAREDKRALAWIPGKKTLTPYLIKWAVRYSSIRGCTQLAYEKQIQPVNDDSMCDICWVGLDIDWDDNPDFDLVSWFSEWAKVNDFSMIRTSRSGKGIHVLYILEQPIRCKQGMANRIVKAITGPIKEGIEAFGIHVCKADKRMFWLCGGKNDILKVKDYKLKTDITFEDLDVKLAQKNYSQQVEVSPGVQKYVDIFKDAGVLPQTIRAHNEIYVGNAVKALQALGETVNTQSGCSGNGNVNGYIDIMGKRISLWAYADGHTIWTYDDVEAMLT